MRIKKTFFLKNCDFNVFFFIFILTYNKGMLMRNFDACEKYKSFLLFIDDLELFNTIDKG